jgi:hypothetical protein
VSWLRRGSRASGRPAENRPLVDPDPLRTPEDAFETGFLIGALKNTWQAVVVKNLTDRRIATGDPETSHDTVGPAGHVAGHRAGEE